MFNCFPDADARVGPGLATPLLLRPRGSHLHTPYSSVCNRDQGFWSTLIAWSFPSDKFWGSWVLDFQRVKGQIASVCSWSIDFSSLEVTLIPWLAPKRSFDHLIQFWSWSQMLLHGTYVTTPCKTKVPVRQDSTCFCGLLWQSVASFPDSQCILTWFIASLLVEPWNELGCKPNSGHVVMYPSLVVCRVSRAETASSTLKVG